MILGIRGIEESSVYQAILAKGVAQGLAEGKVEGKVEGQDEGKDEEAKRLLLRLGQKRFGPPSPQVIAATVLRDAGTRRDDAGVLVARP